MSTLVDVDFVNKNIPIAGQGCSQLGRHGKGTKHQRNKPKDDANSILLHLKPGNSSSSSKEEVKQMEVKQTKLFSPHEKQLATNAEIMWAIDVILSKYSYNLSANKMDLFCAMFPNSDIAKHFSCGKTKCSYLVCFGTSPYFKELLEETVNEVEHYVALFDESYNAVSKKSQMDFHIRYWIPLLIWLPLDIGSN